MSLREEDSASLISEALRKKFVLKEEDTAAVKRKQPIMCLSSIPDPAAPCKSGQLVDFFFKVVLPVCRQLMHLDFFMLQEMFCIMRVFKVGDLKKNTSIIFIEYVFCDKMFQLTCGFLAVCFFSLPHYFQAFACGICTHGPQPFSSDPRQQLSARVRIKKHFVPDIQTQKRTSPVLVQHERGNSS